MTDDEFESRIRELAAREMEVENLFEDIKKGRGEQSFRYVTLRDACQELRREILRTAMAQGLTRERVRQVIFEARNQATKPV